jgi:phosphate uptake regulator
MGITYRQKDKSKFWNSINKIKMIFGRGQTCAISLSKKWLTEMGLKKHDHVMITYDANTKTILIRRLDDKEKEEYNLSNSQLPEVQI